MLLHEKNLIVCPGFPTIETYRLALTPLVPSDAAYVFALFSDSRIIEFYDMEIFSKEDEAHSWIEKHQARFEKKEGIRWAIRFKEESALLGTCGFNALNAHQRWGEIGYEINPDFWGNGIATEAVRSIVEWAFSIGFGHPLHRIVANIMLKNDASGRLLQKLGFQEEGIARGSGHWKGRFHDLRVFALLSSVN